MTYASISIDRRPEYSERLAAHMRRTSEPNKAWAEHYAREDQGRRLQGNIQKQDLTRERLLAMGRKPAKVLRPKQWQRA